MLFRVSQTTSENYESIAAGFVKFGRRNLRLAGDLAAICIEGAVNQCAVVYMADGLGYAPYIMPYITA